MYMSGLPAKTPCCSKLLASGVLVFTSENGAIRVQPRALYTLQLIILIW